MEGTIVLWNPQIFKYQKLNTSSSDGPELNLSNMMIFCGLTLWHNLYLLMYFAVDHKRGVGY